MTDNSECEASSGKGVLATVLISLALAMVLVACCWRAFWSARVEFGYRVVDRDLAPLLESSQVFYKTSADAVYSGRQQVRVDVGQMSPDGFVNVALPGNATFFRLDVAFQDRPEMFLSRKELVLEVDAAGKRREITLQFRKDKPFYAWENFPASDYSVTGFNAWACMSAFCLAWIFMFMGVSLLGRMRSVHANVLFVCAFVAVCALPSAKMDKSPSSSRENRNLAKFPDVEDVREEGLSAWCREFEAAFADRFLGRSGLMDMHSSIMGAFDDMGNFRVHVGREGWLFLKSTLADFSNSAPMYDERTTEKIRRYLESINNYAKSRNKKFVVFIAPDKCRVYPEHVRYYRKVRPDSESRTERVVAYLKERCDFPVVYPREEMLRLRDSYRFPLYYKYDTHWTWEGAYRAGYKVICDAIGMDELQKASEALERIEWMDDGRFTTHDLATMLGRGATGKGMEPSRLPQWRDDGVKIDNDLKCWDVQRTVSTTSGANGLKLYCLRDSFCEWMIPFLARSFSQCRMRHQRKGIREEDLAYIDTCDVMLLEIVERDLLDLADASLPARFGKEVR